MSHNQHRQNQGRLSNLDIYNDAAKILEELLEKRLERNLKVPVNVRRNRKGHNSKITADFNSESTLVEDKIRPIRHSASLDNQLSKKDLTYLFKNVFKGKTKPEHNGGSESSIDTDDDQAQFSDKRRKKSLFKMAKERLRRTFNRHEKDGTVKGTSKNNNDSLPPSGQKLTNKQRNNGRNKDVEQDKSVEHIKDRSKEILTDRKTRPVKKGFSFSSFRSAKKSSRAEVNTYSQEDKKGHILKSPKDSHERATNKHADKKHVSGKDQLSSLQRSHTSSDTPTQPLPSLQKSDRKSSMSPSPSPHYHLGYLENHTRNVSNVLQPSPSPAHLSTDRNTSPSHQVLPSQSKSPSPSSKSLNHAGINTATTSTSSCNILQSGNTSDGSAATKTFSSIQSNILDSPGEDIEYMEVDDHVMLRRNKTVSDNFVRGIHASGVQIHNRENTLDLNGLADQQSSEIISLELEKDQRVISPQRHGRKTETTLVARSKGNVIVTEVQEQIEIEGSPLQPHQSSLNKEAMYGKIAQRLIEMSEVYSLSEQETTGAAEAQPSSLTGLETDIIACLRKEGDRYSKQLDESFDAFAQQTTQEAYQRFHSTLQNSVGSDLSWDHLAFLFYTTKGVVSAVGKGSRAANQVKEFTLQYISDTFASWIMDQGGFDSVLSSAESDFDVD